MKASALMAKLAKLIAEHGDKDVYRDDDSYNPQPLTDVYKYEKHKLVSWNREVFIIE